MKNSLLLILGSLLLVPCLASAGALYGTVRMGAAPAAAVTISVACPGFGQPSSPGVIETVSDAGGSFSLLVQASGRCEMRARRAERVGRAFTVFVSNNPLRFDFVIDAAMNPVP